MGLAHQVIIRLSRPAVTMAASPMRPSFTAIQRVRVTLWFQASRYVPASNSRAIRGAPQNMPMSAGVSVHDDDAAEEQRGVRACP